MEVLHFDIDHVPLINDKLNLCLGFFDGVHLGHQKLIDEAKKYDGKLAILSFESSPKEFENSRLITPLNEKIEIFKNLGCDYLLLLKVDDELIKTSHEAFINKCLARFDINHLICGDDFTFGYQGLGRPNDLAKLYQVDAISLLNKDGRKIASRDIKNLIMNGEVEKANLLMNRPYQITGLHKRGFGKGRTLGFNTLNVSISNEYIVPKYGVYLTYNYVDGEWIYGLTNVGIHPTLNKLNEPLIEAHLLDYDKYCEIKEPVKVKFIKFIRSEKRFDSVSDLQKQVLSDIKDIKEYLKSK